MDMRRPSFVFISLVLLLTQTGCAVMMRDHTRYSDDAASGESHRAAAKDERAEFLPAHPVGGASYYARRFNGRRTASGTVYDENEMTAAHRTLPFGSVVRVTNLSNQRSVIVTITDRGPFVRHRVIDLSRRAAQKLDFIRKGITKVRLELLERSATNAEPR